MINDEKTKFRYIARHLLEYTICVAWSKELF